MNGGNRGIIVTVVIAVVTAAVFIGQLEGRVSSLEGRVSSLERIDFKNELETAKAEVLALSPLPPGTILALGRSGATPKGWVVCGENGTPRLDGRFLIGTDQSKQIGEHIGDENHYHSVEIKTGYQVDGKKGGPEGADNYTGKNWSHKHMTTGKTAVGKHIPPSVKVLFLCKAS